MLKIFFFLLFIIPICFKKKIFIMVQNLWFILFFFVLLFFQFNFFVSNISFFIGIDLISYGLILLRI